MSLVLGGVDDFGHRPGNGPSGYDGDDYSSQPDGTADDHETSFQPLLVANITIPSTGPRTWRRAHPRGHGESACQRTAHRPGSMTQDSCVAAKTTVPATAGRPPRKPRRPSSTTVTAIVNGSLAGIATVFLTTHSVQVTLIAAAAAVLLAGWR